MRYKIAIQVVASSEHIAENGKNACKHIFSYSLAAFYSTIKEAYHLTYIFPCLQMPPTFTGPKFSDVAMT